MTNVDTETTTTPTTGFAGSAVIAQMFEAFYAGDMARLEQFIDPEIRVWQSAGLPYSGVYEGIAGFLEMAQKVYAHAEVDNRLSRMLDSGDETVVFMDLKFTDRASGRTAESPNVEWYTFKDGRVVSIDVYYKDSAAVAALAN
jgi:ketosteroid isomerase-like protein